MDFRGQISFSDAYSEMILSEMCAQGIGEAVAMLLPMAIYLATKGHGWRKEVKAWLTKMQSWYTLCLFTQLYRYVRIYHALFQ